MTSVTRRSMRSVTDLHAAAPPTDPLATGRPTGDPPAGNHPMVEFEDRMSAADAVMWTIEKDPMLRSTITTVVLVDGEIDQDAIERTFERASRVVPRLRQRVRHNPLSIAPPRWEIDPNFDLRYHLRSARATGTGSMGDLLAMAAPIAMQGFDRARPLWEATTVDGLDGDRSAIILKIHHAITDGVGGVALMLELFDLAADAEERPMPPRPDARVMSQIERFVDAFVHESRHQSTLARTAAAGGFETLRSTVSDPAASAEATGELAASVLRLVRPESRPLSPIMRNRSLSSHFDVLTMPLDMAKKVGHLIGGTLNDTFMGGILRGMQLYHAHHGAAPSRLRIGMPINVRSSGSAQKAGNAFVPARMEVPALSEDPEELMRDVRARCLASARRARQPARRADVGPAEPAPDVGRHPGLRFDAARPGRPGVERAGLTGAALPARSAGRGDLPVRSADRRRDEHHAAQLPERAQPRGQPGPGRRARPRPVPGVPPPGLRGPAGPRLRRRRECGRARVVGAHDRP